MDEVQMSTTFFEAVDEAAQRLTLPDHKVFLKPPFSGFFVTLQKPEGMTIVSERKIGDKKIFVVCQNILG